MTIRTNQRNQKMQLETRQTQLFIQYNNKFDPLQNTLDEIIDEWTWSDNNDFMQRYGPESNPDEWMKFRLITGLYEQMGILATHGFVDVKLVYNLQGSHPISLWDKYEGIIDYLARSRKIKCKHVNANPRERVSMV
jgi:hypothetical protein